jgi:hypothetical protein
MNFSMEQRSASPKGNPKRNRISGNQLSVSSGKARADYGEVVLKALSYDLTAKHGRGFSRANFQQMRLFYIRWEIFQTPSGKLEARMILSAEATGLGQIYPTVSGKSYRCFAAAIS